MSNNDSKLVTKGYLEEYNKSICNEVIKVVNDITLNSSQVTKSEYIDQNSEGLLTLHYKQVEQSPTPILESYIDNEENVISLKGNISIEGNMTIDNSIDLEESGGITSKQDKSATIRNGIISGFDVQNCTGMFFEIDVAYDENYAGDTITKMYKISQDNLSILDIINIYRHDNIPLVLKLQDKLDNGMISIIRITNFSIIERQDELIFEIENTDGTPIRITDNAIVFTPANNEYYNNQSFILCEIDGTLRCLPYTYNPACRVEVEFSQLPDASRGIEENLFSSLEVSYKNQNIISDGNTNLNECGRLILKAMKENSLVSVHIALTSRAAMPFDVYTTDCNYIYTMDISDSSLYYYIIIKYPISYNPSDYTDPYNITSYTYKDYILTIPCNPPQNNA